jgi:hypothetical protein
MRRTVSGFVALAMAALAVGASPAAAQDASQTIKPERVVVKRVGGLSDLHGQFGRLNADTVTIVIKGQPMDVPLASVRRVDVGGDSVKNGAIIGGIVLPLWCALVCGQGLDHGVTIEMMSVLAVEGAALGALIDRGFNDRSTIYIRTPRGEFRTPPSPQISYSVRF